jgi:hypothetical protein
MPASSDNSPACSPPAEASVPNASECAIIVKAIKPKTLIDADIDALIKDTVGNQAEFCRAFMQRHTWSTPQDFKDYVIQEIRTRFPERLESLNITVEETLSCVNGKRIVSKVVLNRESILAEKLRNIYKQFSRNRYHSRAKVEAPVVPAPSTTARQQ